MWLWLREELYILFHRESPILSWRGLWQTARMYVWIQAIWCLLTGALLISDGVYRRYNTSGDPLIVREFFAGLVILLLGVGLWKILVLRLGVFNR